MVCREISAAQRRLTDVLEGLYVNQPGQREVVRLAMSAIGRGGEGDVGQRIRDEILVVQQNNNAKGGMMEEWHQKLHNNTSPDDVVICQVSTPQSLRAAAFCAELTSDALCSQSQWAFLSLDCMESRPLASGRGRRCA